MAAWNPRANELFLNALDLASPAERQAYLNGACVEDAPLRKAVEALLKAHAAAGSALEPTIDSAGPTETMAMPSPGEGAGATIGNYKLLQLPGEGGFGSVFMAAQEKPVRRRVARELAVRESNRKNPGPWRDFSSSPRATPAIFRMKR